MLVGIDPSLTATSLAFVDDAGAVVVERIETDPKRFDSPPQRLDYMRGKLADFVLAHGPTSALIEGYAFNSKTHAHSLGEWGGVLRDFLWRSGVRYAVVSPTTLKSYVCGTGAAAKELMLREVWRRWQFEASDNNDADAFGLAMLGRELAGQKLTKKLAAVADQLTYVLPRGQCPAVVALLPRKPRTARGSAP